jgi:hypothetical protein
MGGMVRMWNCAKHTARLSAHQVQGDPVALNACQLGLNLLLFHCCSGDFLKLLPVLQDVAVQQVLQLENIISQLQLLACTAATSAITDCQNNISDKLSLGNAANQMKKMLNAG